ncbi:hypothetical protein LMG31506_02288 [Cupriavidus yeoncheonensis]|uniref:Uncharacterized protein n=1 Tax=Cupriavidus yeoncheonensis TaxID=1462994 RepID=A0A916ITB1_9BURK|nr:hypothetical protein [Cupriavidus yeoncheonensis]CAG2140307.1 hypothetical protein LMG31506_02288 [Cupriavidus yeoncheonensis]
MHQTSLAALAATIAAILSVLSFMNSNAPAKVDLGKSALAVQITEMDKRYTARMDTLDKQLDRIEVRADKADERLRRIEARLESIDAKLDRVLESPKRR